jgi:sialate O-acetylesterase
MKSYLLAFISFISIRATAVVTPNSLFSNNMVLQRNIAVPVWGTADNNETITVSFNGQTVSTKAANCKWMLQLTPMKESSIGLSMTIKGATNEITINNILIGEVWLCGGQSNMERQLGLRPPQKPIVNWQEEAAKANYPLIREFAVPHNSNTTKPVIDIKANWVVCDTQTVKQFSAVGYFFGRDLFEKLNVPIGLIHSSVGGTPAERWTSRDALENNPELKIIVDQYFKDIEDFPSKLEFFQRNKDSLFLKWKEDSALAKSFNKTIPVKPREPSDPRKNGDCGGLYQTMIEPLIPYAIKGVIWYQGEANSGRAKQYQALFPVLIKDWRAKWKEGDFPFLFVQLAPWRGTTPEAREAQLLTWQRTPNTAMVVTIDCGDTADIHPTNKKPVGERLALAARAIAYKEKIEYSGPAFDKVTFKGKEAVLEFTHIGKGLTAKGDSLMGFNASEDGKQFFTATAVIRNNRIIVSAEKMNNITAVRYAFKNNAEGNLYNIDGLPASPFRTDNK